MNKNPNKDFTDSELPPGFVPMVVMTHKEFIKKYYGVELTDEIIENSKFEKYLPKKKKRK